MVLFISEENKSAGYDPRTCSVLGVRAVVSRVLQLGFTNSSKTTQSLRFSMNLVCTVFRMRSHFGPIQIQNRKWKFWQNLSGFYCISPNSYRYLQILETSPTTEFWWPNKFVNPDTNAMLSFFHASKRNSVPELITVSYLMILHNF